MLRRRMRLPLIKAGGGGLSLESVLFLIVIAAGIIVAARRVYSEKPPARGKSTGAGVDAPTFDGTNDALLSESAVHDSSHTSGCEIRIPTMSGPPTVDMGLDGGGHH